MPTSDHDWIYFPVTKFPLGNYSSLLLWMASALMPLRITKNSNPSSTTTFPTYLTKSPLHKFTSRLHKATVRSWCCSFFLALNLAQSRGSGNIGVDRNNLPPSRSILQFPFNPTQLPQTLLRCWRSLCSPIPHTSSPRHYLIVGIPTCPRPILHLVWHHRPGALATSHCFLSCCHMLRMALAVFFCFFFMMSKCRKLSLPNCHPLPWPLNS